MVRGDKQVAAVVTSERTPVSLPGRDPRRTQSASKSQFPTHSMRVTKSAISGVRTVTKDDIALDSRMTNVETGIAQLVELLKSGNTAVPAAPVKKARNTKKAAPVPKVVTRSAKRDVVIPPALPSVSVLFDSDGEGEELLEPARPVAIGAGVIASPQPVLVKSFEVRQRRRNRMLASSYYLHDDDGGTSSQSGSKLERTDLLHSCQAREFVQTELVEGMYDTGLQLVRSHRFKQERNKQECEFVACAIDFLVKDVGGAFVFLLWGWY